MSSTTFTVERYVPPLFHSLEVSELERLTTTEAISILGLVPLEHIVISSETISPDTTMRIGSAALEKESMGTEVAPEGSLGANGITSEAAKLQFAAGDTSKSEVGVTSDLSPELAREKYNRSLRAYRALGRLARSGALETSAGKAARENAMRDLVTSLAEIFENGEEFRGGFEISDLYEYPIIDGEVYYMTADGLKPIQHVMLDGAAVSRAAANVDPLMMPQAERDEADVHNGIRVNDMAAGRLGVNTRFVVSRDLGRIIRPGSPHRELYLGKGYRERLAFGQLYFADGDTLTTGTFSVDGVSDEVFDAVLARHGVVMPDGESRHQSVRYGIELVLPNKDAAVAFAQQFRKDCYALQRDMRVRRSATQFINDHQAQISSYFNALGLPLAVSLPPVGSETGTKDSAIHDFVGNLLRKPEHLKDEVVSQLRRIHQSEGFTDDDGRLLSGVIIYAIAEALYGDAIHFVRDGSQPAAHPNVRVAGPLLHPEQIRGQLVNSVYAGAEAGRSHRGPCPGDMSISKLGSQNSLESTSSQGAFGGREGDNKTTAGDSDRSNWKFKYQACEIKSCPNSKKVVKCGPCGVCMARCQEQYYDWGKDPTKAGFFALTLETGATAINEIFGTIKSIFKKK